jgi:hypothetical protein
VFLLLRRAISGFAKASNALHQVYNSLVRIAKTYTRVNSGKTSYDRYAAFTVNESCNVRLEDRVNHAARLSRFLSKEKSALPRAGKASLAGDLFSVHRTKPPARFRLRIFLAS